MVPISFALVGGASFSFLKSLCLKVFKSSYLGGCGNYVESNALKKKRKCLLFIYLFEYLSYLRKLNDHNGRPIHWLLPVGLGLGCHVVFSWADILRTCIVLICDFPFILRHLVPTF
jgi:hypothetical protein